MTVVVDSNILIASVLTDEPLHSKASELLAFWEATRMWLVAPRLFRSEVAAVVRKAVYQKRIHHEPGRLLLLELLSYPVDFFEDDDLLKDAYDIAYRFNRPRAYDSQYMALAERLDCEFWTADAVLVNSTQQTFDRIRWLGSFNMQPS